MGRLYISCSSEDPNETPAANPAAGNLEESPTARNLEEALAAGDLEEALAAVDQNEAPAADPVAIDPNEAPETDPIADDFVLLEENGFTHSTSDSNSSDEDWVDYMNRWDNPVDNNDHTNGNVDERGTTMFGLGVHPRTRENNGHTTNGGQQRNVRPRPEDNNGTANSGQQRNVRPRTGNNNVDGV